MDFPNSPSLNDTYTLGDRTWIWNGVGWKLLKASNTSITATSLLTSIKTVDGTGSGLDADLLDGQDGSYYLDLTNATGNVAANQVSTLGPINLQNNTYNISITGSANGNVGTWASYLQEQYTYGLRSQRNISGGGTVSVSSLNEVGWTSRFLVMSNGKSVNTATGGYFDITQPAAGTSIPVVGGTSVTATAAGIPLATWRALYYILPLASGSTSLATNFRIVDYTLDANIPPEWVLICVNNGDQSLFYFPNGVKLKATESLNVASYDARNSQYLQGLSWVSPGTIGSTTANSGTFTSIVTNNASLTGTGSGALLVGGYSQISGYASAVGIKFTGAGTLYGLAMQPGSDGTTFMSFFNAANTLVGSLTQNSTSVSFNGYVAAANVIGTVLTSNNSTYLGGYTWAAPSAIGGTTVNTAAFSTVTATTSASIGGNTTILAIPSGNTTNQTPQIQAVRSTVGFAAVSAAAYDATYSHRAGLFVDTSNWAWGLSHTYGSNNIPFVLKSGAVERMRIDINGNTGINNTTPAHTLSVGGTLAAGNTTITGSIQVGGTVLNSTFFAAQSNTALTANNSTYLNGQLAAYYTNATNITTGTMPYAQLPANAVFWSNNNTFLGNQTFANITLATNGTKIAFAANSLASGNQSYFTLQTDNNFVFYQTYTDGTARPVWASFTNSNTSALQVLTPLKVASALQDGAGSNGAAGYYLQSNGTGVNWVTAPGGAFSNGTTYIWSAPQTYTANIAMTSNTTSIMFAGASDNNWKLGRNIATYTKAYYSNNSLDVLIGSSSKEGITFGNIANTSFLEMGSDGNWFRANVAIGNVAWNAMLTVNGTVTFANSTGNTLNVYANGQVAVREVTATGSGTFDTVVTSNNGNGTNIKIGDDAWFGDINTADTVSIRGQFSANNGYIVFGNADTTTKLGRAGTGPLTYNGNFTATGNVSVSTINATSWGATITSNTTTAVLTIGNSSVSTTVNGTTFSGTANNTSFVGTVSAANVVSNAQLSANLSSYQTTAGLSANVATLTSNNTSFVGTVSAANVVSNAQLSANLTNYQTTAGLSANVATLSANNADYLDGQHGAYYTNASNISTGTLAFARLPTVDAVNNTSITLVPVANNVKTAYDAAITANTNAATALTAAGSAYTNAVSYTDGKILTANSAITGNAATAYTNATSFASNASNISTGTLAFARLPTVDAVNNTSITLVPVANNVKTAYDAAITANTNAATALTAAGSAYTNAVSYTDGKILTANSAITGNAATAYTNAVTFAANASNITNGTLPYAQIPANVTNTTANFSISGAWTFNANVTLGAADNLVLSSTSGISANGSYGSNGQVLTSNGTSLFWGSPSQSSRVVDYANSSTFTVNADSTDIATMVYTGATGTLTIANTTGTPINGQKLIYRIQCTNSQTLSFAAGFTGSTDLALPTTTSGSSKYDYLGFIYNSTSTTWHLLAKNFGF